VQRVLRLGILAAAPWGFVTACASPSYARAYPRRTAIRASYLAAYASVVVALALLSPLLLVPVAGIALMATLLGLWMARPGAGRSRRLPPGPLSLVPVRQFVNEGFLARQIERHGAISKTTWPTLDAPLVCVHGLRRAAEILRGQSSALGPVGISFNPVIPAGFLRNMRPEDHRRYKPLFERALPDELVAARLPDFDRAVRNALQSLAAASVPNGVDPRPYLLRASLTAFAPLLVGVEPGTAEEARLVGLYERIGEFVEIEDAQSEEGQAFSAVLDELAAIVGSTSAGAVNALAEGREPGPSVVAEIARSSPDALADPNVFFNLIFLLRTASSDVGGLLHWIMKELAEHPDWQERVRSGDDDVARRVALETLRLHQSEFIQRRVLQPLDIDGYHVPADWYVRLCVRESHRDPEVFSDPEVFDPDRFLDRRFSRYEFSPFGRLEHRCIGETATIGLAAAFVSRLSNDFDWSVTRDGPAEFNRYHWRPSRRFRVRLRERSPVI
jgi:cytochrome P450